MASLSRPHARTDDAAMLFLSVFTGLLMAGVERAWPLIF
jgi:hypothetical protein